MKHELPTLPYAYDALEPHMSRESLEFHYGKHHQGYVAKLNDAIEGTGFARYTLEEVVRKSDGNTFNQAAQVWNHTFYWHSMSPSGGGKPVGMLAQRIIKDFNSFEDFKEVFAAAATGHFGSGWGWLVQRPDGSLAVIATANAETPLTAV